MDCADVQFSGHAIRRMFERGLSRHAILITVRKGEVIADYPDDKPYPSCLVLGVDAGKPVHVVVARENEQRHCVVVTVYQPDPAIWTDDFKRRRQP